MYKYTTILTAFALLYVASCTNLQTNSNQKPEFPGLFCQELAQAVPQHGLAVENCQATMNSEYSMDTHVGLRRAENSAIFNIKRSFSIKDSTLSPTLIKRFTSHIINTALKDLS